MRRFKRLRQSSQRRAHRVRNRLRRAAGLRPRLSVHRTNKHIYAQVVDDERGVTLCNASSMALHLPRGGNVAAAREVGTALGRIMKEKEILRIGFDRGRARYHGRVKALADAVREAGIEF